MEIKDSVKNLFEPELVEELLQVGKLKTAKEGDVIISIGQPIVYMPIVLEGILKVSMIDDNGKELLMYYLNAADGCAMTFTCCMQEAKSEI